LQGLVTTRSDGFAGFAKLLEGGWTQPEILGVRPKLRRPGELPPAAAV